jgi:ribosomal protein S18 acetylase RimI-like enzyme
VITQRGLVPSDRALVAELLASVGAFSGAERAVALELVDARLARPEVDDYRFILGFDTGAAGERLAGYLCYGHTPLTQSTYDLYWVATSPDFARSGVARALLAAMEEEIVREGGGTLRVETGSREGHGAAVHFYDAMGFARTATIADFYAPGDDLIIFTKRVRTVPAPSLPLDEAALYDAAFGYRDYAAERDFFLACASRFGEREVRSVLAWACGPARHLCAFASQGTSGLGVDASEAMLAYARQVAGRERSPASIRFLKAALYEKPDAGPFDLSFVPLSSIHLLPTPAALERHLGFAADVLRPGGVHVIEATHPADLLPSGVNRTEWTERRGDQVIDARFRLQIDACTDGAAGKTVPATLEVVCSTGRKGGPMSRFKQEDRWFIPDLDGWRAVIARVPELRLEAALGDFNVEVPFEHAAAWRLILVLKRV